MPCNSFDWKRHIMRKETVTYCNSFDWEQLSEEDLVLLSAAGMWQF